MRVLQLIIVAFIVLIVGSVLMVAIGKVRDAANKRMREDSRMKEMGEHMPFDGKRMIFGGFAPILDE